LDEVYSTWQDMLKVKKPYAENRKMHPEIYSMYAAMASRAEPNDPLYLNEQAFSVVETHNKFARYFLDIRIAKGVRIYCPLRTKQNMEGKINDSKLVRRDGHYELHLFISKEIEINTHPSSILSVDMGERNIATAVLFASSCTSNQSKPLFMGRNVRGLRRRYAYLRKKLGEKKLLKVIRKVGNTEQRKINDMLHKISRELVNIAKQNNAVILLGDLTGIRDRTRGRRMNRIVANMPFYRLTQYITYKASWEGIPILSTKEWYSSKICHKCGSDNTSRPHQGLFICHACGYQCNADFNGASNLAKRLWNYMFHDGILGFGCENRTTFCDSIRPSIGQPKT